MTKMWGDEPYFGLSYDFDPQWYLTDEQREIEVRLIELCHSTIAPHAIECDRDSIFPRKSMEALASQDLLALHVPRKYGGMGQNHVCVAMVLETIARYGCASTALVYTMHLLAVSALLLRAGGNPEIQKDAAADEPRRLHRHRVLFGPRDRLALLVPDGIEGREG